MDVNTDEYTAVSRRVGADIGIDYLDDTTYEAHRLMYWPSHGPSWCTLTGSMS